MNLTIQQVSEIFQVPEKTIFQWIKEDKIPAYKVGHQYRFNKQEIQKWILQNKMNVSHKILDLNESSQPIKLENLVEKGGIHYSLKGSHIQEIFHNAIYSLNTLSQNMKENIVSLLIEREEMMPTGIGKGIAIPHPRNPILTDVEKENISIFFLEKPVEYNALDNQPVHTLFILLSANPKRHLEILSKISFLCKENEFIHLLEKREQYALIMDYIRNKEKEWGS